MAGIKGRSGRRKSIPALVKEALEGNEANLPLYLERLQGIALNKQASPKDRVEAIEYLINRALGSPKATTDVRVSRIVTLTGEQWEWFCQHMDNVKRESSKLLVLSVLDEGAAIPMLEEGNGDTPL